MPARCRGAARLVFICPLLTSLQSGSALRTTPPLCCVAPHAADAAGEAVLAAELPRPRKVVHLRRSPAAEKQKESDEALGFRVPCAHAGAHAG